MCTPRWWFDQQILFLGKTGWDDGTHDGPSWAPRTIEGGLVPKYLEFWKLGTEIDSLNFVTEWQDGPSQTLQRNWVSELCDGATGRTVAGTTARHRLRNPRRGRISLNVLRDVFDYSCFNYKFSGLMLISLITWGVKRGNLKLISGLLFPSFILNYMLIRVKERGFE